MNNKSYIALKKQIHKKGDYFICPIRFNDRYDIMQWRNEQLYHLRQEKLLSKEEQDNYFNIKISKLFDKKKPDQILFSFLKKNKCVGYGGLVHINWIDKNAEISFIMDTSLEEEYFEIHWLSYLSLIEKVAFKELNLHKLFTYAYDIRPHLFPILLKAGYIKDAELEDHCLFEGVYKNVLIHSKFNPNE